MLWTRKLRLREVKNMSKLTKLPCDGLKCVLFQRSSSFHHTLLHASWWGQFIEEHPFCSWQCTYCFFPRKFVKWWKWHQSIQYDLRSSLQKMQRPENVKANGPEAPSSTDCLDKQCRTTCCKGSLRGFIKMLSSNPLFAVSLMPNVIMFPERSGNSNQACQDSHCQDTEFHSKIP